MRKKEKKGKREGCVESGGRREVWLENDEVKIRRIEVE